MNPLSFPQPDDNSEYTCSQLCLREVLVESRWFGWVGLGWMGGGGRGGGGVKGGGGEEGGGGGGWGVVGWMDGRRR